MNSKAALCKALLDGKTVNIKNAFSTLGITNCPREIGRSVERAFGVKVHREPKEGKSRYGQPCVWVDYKLLKTPENRQGISKMRKYLSENIEEYRPGVVGSKIVPVEKAAPQPVKDLFSELM